MDFVGWIVLLRWPLEIVSLGLALEPLLRVWLAWSTLPATIPTHFGASGRPDGWGSRALAWILPVLALAAYGLMGAASGTWEWLLFGRVDLPGGAEIPLLLKPGVALLMSSANAMLLRTARRQGEALNGWMLSGLMLLLIASPLALSAVVR